MSKTLRTLFEITYREDIENVIRELNPVEYAYILHDNDINSNGEKKKAHYHIWCRFEYPIRNESCRKILALNDKHICSSARSQRACFLYMTHESKEAVRMRKTRYERNLIVSNLNEDTIKQLYLSSDNSMVINDIMLLLMEYKDLYCGKSFSDNCMNTAYCLFVQDLIRMNYFEIYNRYYNSIFCRLVKVIFM